jgi:uroporphyrinogen-III synthase
MRALVTRPSDDADQIAAALAARGIEPVFEPLLAIAPVPTAKLDLAGVQALLVTSRNGVRALAAATPNRDVAVFTVGDATAQAAREHGFKTVESAQGDVEALARLVVARLDPKAGPLVHAAGQAVAGDLTGKLAERGFTVWREVLYEASPATALSAATRDLIESGGVDFALLFSPRTAQTFASLVTEAGLADKCRGIAAICLSDAIATRLAGLPWRAIATAARPDLPALIAAIDGVRLGSETEAMADDPNDKPKPAVDPAAPPSAPQRSGGPRSPWRAAAGKRTRSRVPLWSLAALIGLVVVAIAAWPAWRGVAPQSLRTLVGDDVAVEPVAPAAPARDETGQAAASVRALDDRVSALERRLAQPREGDASLERRLAALEARASEPPAVGRAVADPDLARRLAQVELRIAASEGSDQAAESALKAENARLAAQVADFDRRLAALQERAGARRADNHILALAHLRDAVARGGPFASELAAFEAVAKDDAGYADALARLKPYAERGVAPRHELARRFAAAAAAGARAGVVPEGNDWVSRMIARLHTVVSVRRVGDDVPGDQPDAVLARAEARLQADDLAAAAAEVEKLDGPAAASVAAWLADARARLAAERALIDLGRRALAAAAAGQR